MGKQALWGVVLAIHFVFGLRDYSHASSYNTYISYDRQEFEYLQSAERLDEHQMLSVH